MSADEFDHEHYAKYGDPYGEQVATPTREQIAEVLFKVDHGPDARWDNTPQAHEEYLTYSDAVLALLQNGADR